MWLQKAYQCYSHLEMLNNRLTVKKKVNIKIIIENCKIKITVNIKLICIHEFSRSQLNFEGEG